MAINDNKTIWNDNNLTYNYNLYFQENNGGIPSSIELVKRSDSEQDNTQYEWLFEIIDKVYVDNAIADVYAYIDGEILTLKIYVDGQILAVNNKIDLVDAQVQTIIGDIVQIKSDISDNTNKITTIIADVSSLDARVTALESATPTGLAINTGNFIINSGANALVRDATNAFTTNANFGLILRSQGGSFSMTLYSFGYFHLINMPTFGNVEIELYDFYGYNGFTAEDWTGSAMIYSTTLGFHSTTAIFTGKGNSLTIAVGQDLYNALVADPTKGAYIKISINGVSDALSGIDFSDGQYT